MAERLLAVAGLGAGCVVPPRFKFYPLCGFGHLRFQTAFFREAV